MYEVTFRERASREYLDSIIWYKERSLYAAEYFIAAINKTLELLASNPTTFKKTINNFTKQELKYFP